MMKDDAVDDIPTPSVVQAVVGVPFVVDITATLLLNLLLLPASLHALLASLLLNVSMLLLASHAVSAFPASMPLLLASRLLHILSVAGVTWYSWLFRCCWFCTVAGSLSIAGIISIAGDPALSLLLSLLVRGFCLCWDS